MQPILVCDAVEYGLDSWGKKPQTWRVTHHLKRNEDKLDAELAKEKDPANRIVLKMCREFREKDRQKQIERGLPAERRYRLDYCTPEEATHVSLVSICGTIAPLSECKHLGTIEWAPEVIARERKAAVSNFWLKTPRPADWYWE